ncbi:2-polyprenylphenol 6-hydroxylase, partial [Amylibacter sp.]|nr:2-polyprenylphenol 6-hydroxylase [Amylibacter sp.]
QRTMVVVEGVSRSLSPASLDIWEAARPEVEDYIKNNVGPKALFKDIIKAAQTLSHFGPKLPSLLENLLLADSKSPVNGESNIKNKLFWALIGSTLTMLIVIILKHI